MVSILSGVTSNSPALATIWGSGNIDELTNICNTAVAANGSVHRTDPITAAGLRRDNALHSGSFQPDTRFTSPEFYIRLRALMFTGDYFRFVVDPFSRPPVTQGRPISSRTL